jgi:hypothetical protein
MGSGLRRDGMGAGLKREGIGSGKAGTNHKKGRWIIWQKSRREGGMYISLGL